MAKPKKCVRKMIRIKSKRGKVIAEFMGRTGPGCGPRPKPSTRHLSHFKKFFANAAKNCKGRKRGAFLKCMRTETKGAVPFVER